jgi:CubicO group peptidase (beta-lactamase class C family)
MKTILGIMLGCLSLWATAVLADNAAEHDAAVSPQVDQYVDAEMHREKIPGLALAVLREGKIVKVQGYGLSNVELDVPVTPKSIFQTGSVGKQFTATAVMMLVEEGKVGLDDKITKYFPEAPAAWKDITVRNLLTHTSGIPDYDAEEGPKKTLDLRRDYTEDELVSKFASMPLDFPPGSKWSYSNSGYVLLGVLIHRISGQFYGDMLEQRVFQPLHMDATHIISEENIVPHRSAGYRLVNGQLKNQEWVAPKLNTTADGALYTNVLDMAKWDGALTAGTLLSKASYAEMYTPVRLTSGNTYPYGFGWSFANINGHPVIEHDGAWQGFSTDIARFVDDKLTVIVLANLDSSHANPWKIGQAVAALYVPELKAKEDSKTEKK